jgi:hypothetical protein
VTDLDRHFQIPWSAGWTGGEGHAELLRAFGGLMQHALQKSLPIEARNGVVSEIKRSLSKSMAESLDFLDLMSNGFWFQTRRRHTPPASSRTGGNQHLQSADA